jgi:exopolysaccharide biosynthesis polyprenyl glycosylphosphotransferase
MLRYNLRYQLFLAISDAVIMVLALWLSSVIRIRLDLGAEGENLAFYVPPVLYVLAPLLWIIAFRMSALYRPYSGAGESLVLLIGRVVRAHALASLLFFGALYIGLRDFSRLQAVYVIALSFGGVMAHRLILSLFHARLASAINMRRDVIIIGDADNAQRVAQAIHTGEEIGLNLAATVPIESNDANALSALDDLPALVKAHDAKEVIVAVKWFDQRTSALVSRVMRVLEREAVNIRVAPDYSELAYFQAHPEDFNGVTMVGLRETILTPTQRIVKRVCDIAFALIMLMITLPLMLIITLAIKLDSAGPALFPQMRVGQHGRRFRMYKFRSMVIDADRIISREEANRLSVDKTLPDPRITRVGRFLRRTSLDELPQFFNILIGDMSVVGPRPEVTWLAEDYEWWQRKRFEVPQGLTGWWQVNGRSDKPMQFNIDQDLYYVRHYSLWMDFQILLRTVTAVITRRGAY